MEVKLPAEVFSEMQKKYDMSKLKHFSKEELIDIVHKAKCGKLKNMDTTGMSKEDILAHLITSKCPEIHSMIVEIEETKAELDSFIAQYLKDGKTIKKENIYYSGLQDVILSAFLVDAVETGRYDCLIGFTDSSMSLNLFPNSEREYGYNLDTPNLFEILKALAKRIKECVDKGVKIIAIPFTHHNHANVLIYRVAEKTFERFEPHGSTSRVRAPSYLADRIYTVIEKADDKVYKYPVLEELIKTNKKLIKRYEKEKKEALLKLIEKNEKTILELKTSYIFHKTELLIEHYTKKKDKKFLFALDYLQHIVKEKATTANLIDENVNEKINKQLETILTRDLPIVDSFFDGVKYIAPDIITVAEKGLQAIEPIQLKTKLSEEDYDNRIGGFCVLWSILYLDLVFKFPNKSPSILLTSLLDLLKTKGETGFADLALGFLEHIKTIINKHYKGLNYSLFTKKNEEERKKSIGSFTSFFRQKFLSKIL